MSNVPADATERLFSYGTLQQPEVQLATFGRTLEGAPDSLPGYAMTYVTITDPEVLRLSGNDQHPIVRRSENPNDAVAGSVLLITHQELLNADDYEVDDYARFEVTLGSGLQAWVYLAAQ